MRLIERAVLVEHDVQAKDVLLVPKNSVPKTSSGKLQRGLAREMYQAEAFAVLARTRGDGHTVSGL